MGGSAVVSKNAEKKNKGSHKKSRKQINTLQEKGNHKDKNKGTQAENRRTDHVGRDSVETA